MKRLFHQLLSNGLTDSTTISEAKKIRLLNGICLLGMLMATLFLSKSAVDYLNNTFIVDDGILLIYADLLMFTISSLTYFLQYKGKTTTARYLFTIAVVVRGIAFNFFIEPDSLNEYGYVFIPVLALIFFQRTIVQYIFLGIAILVMIFAIQKSTYYASNDHLDPFDLTIFFIITFLAVKFLKSINQQNEKLLLEEKEKVIDNARLIEKQSLELKKLEAFKNHFFINLSHEIRTPLTLIHGYAKQLTKHKYADKPVEIILEESLKIKDLVDNIIDLTKLENKHFKLEKTEVDLTRLVLKSHADFQLLFSERNISFTIDIPKEIIKIWADQVQLERAFTNLITNACKYGREGGEARIVLQKDLDGFSLSVYNSGKGIRKAEYEKVFDRYYQSEGEIEKSEGSGIGLSITKAILEEHQFSIHVDSKENEYAQFNIHIPRSFIISTNFERQTNNKHGELSEPPFSIKKNRPTILLVDDHESMRTYIKSLSELDSFNMIEATNGNEAVDLLKNQSIDLVLTDYMMPHMNGLELVEYLKKEGYSQPIIVITAQTAPENKLKLLRIGVDGYITKPFEPEELIISIQKSFEFDQERKEYIQTAEKQLPVSELDHFQKKLHEIIHQKLNDGNLTIADLTDALHMTERTLFRRIKELTGATPAKLIEEAKLKKAKYYFDHRQYKSVRQLGMAVGFSNGTRFAQKFKDRFSIDLQQSFR